jgi:hypothetical protein
MADTAERTLYYRVQWADCPPFTADNAWSALWGSERAKDGSQSACGCDGWEDCTSCGGTGWQDCVRGYSAAGSPEALIRYFTHRARDGVVGPADTVVVFAGTWTGTGPEGEPCVVPVEVVETLSWAEFVARHAAS